MWPILAASDVPEDGASQGSDIASPPEGPGSREPRGGEFPSYIPLFLSLFDLTTALVFSSLLQLVCLGS